MKKILIAIAALAESPEATPEQIKAVQEEFKGTSVLGAQVILRRVDMESKTDGTVRDARALVAALREQGVNIQTASVRFSPRAGSHECEETVDLLQPEGGGHEGTETQMAAGEKVGEGEGAGEPPVAVKKAGRGRRRSK